MRRQNAVPYLPLGGPAGVAAGPMRAFSKRIHSVPAVLGVPTRMRLTSSAPHMPTRLGPILLLGSLLPFVALAQTTPTQTTPIQTTPIQAATTALGSQNATQSTGQTTPTLHPNPMNQLKSMEPAASEEYQLGGGDDITLEFAGRPDISGKHTIGPDGRITLPMAGAITLAGLSREQAAQAIDQAMSKYYTNISCIVGVDKYGSNRVLVTGYVEHPGIMYFDQTPTLLEAITRAGLLQPTGTGHTIDDPIPERVAIYRGNDEAIWVDVKGLLGQGSAMADMRLRRNDTIFVPNDQDRFVSILGEVNHPGAIQLKHNSTLPSMIAEAGGITEKAGNNPEIMIIDPATGTKRPIRYKDLLTPTGALEVSLKPGEVVYIPRGGMAKTGYVLQQLSPLTTALTFGAAFH
jgi:polysaccharide export outer membrane protein